MKIDKFTKVVLTVIAVNLTLLTVKNLDIIPKAYANESTSKVKFTPSMNYGLVPLNDDGSITVKLSSYDEIDVNITNISTYDNLKVVVDEVDPYAFSYCTVPVKIK
jgi:hypothetical protein